MPTQRFCHDERVTDYTALTEPAHPDEVRGFALWASDPQREWEPMPRVRYTLIDALDIIIPFMVFPVVAVAPFVFFASSSGVPPFLALFLLLILGCGILAVVLQARSNFAGLDWESMYRLHEFAEDNGLQYFPAPARAASADEERYPGQLFQPGRRVYNRLRSTTGRFMEIGSVRWANGGSAKGTWYINRGYVAVQLDRHLPRMVLDAEANSGAHNAVLVGGSGTVVRLEGDFNEHFTLRVPIGYERDALYVLTPDLMALLIDETSAFDVELVDDWMFLYSPQPFVAADPVLYERLFRILSTVGVKAVTQTSRYRDSRAPWSGQKGARFVRGTPLWVVIISWGAIGAFALVLVLSLFAVSSIQFSF